MCSACDENNNFYDQVHVSSACDETINVFILLREMIEETINFLINADKEGQI